MDISILKNWWENKRRLESTKKEDEVFYQFCEENIMTMWNLCIVVDYLFYNTTTIILAIRNNRMNGLIEELPFLLLEIEDLNDSFRAIEEKFIEENKELIRRI